MSAPCLFCRIADGTVRVHEVVRTPTLVAFLDNGPIRPGHLQIMPLAHHAYFDDMPGSLLIEIVLLGQRLAKAQKTVVGVERVAFLFTGGDVPHAHAHLVPMVEGTDITSRRYIVEDELTFRGRPDPGASALAEMAGRLSTVLATD